MAALALTLKRDTPTHRNFVTTGGGAADTITNAQLAPAGASPGPIKTFLATVFADEAAANAAAAAAGIELYAHGSGGVSLLRWVATAEAPKAALTSAAATGLVVGIRGPAGIGG
jgi:hypothetical protein